MNYYDDLLCEIKQLLSESKLNEALERLNVELRMPYIPREIEEKMKNIRNEIQVELKDDNSRMVIPTDEELEELLFSKSLEEEMMAIQYIRKLRIDTYLGLLKNYLLNPIYDDVQSLIIYLLIECGLNDEFSAKRDGMEITFIPKYCELPEESDGYVFGIEYFDDVIQKEPSLYKMCVDLLHMRLLKYLPMSYEEEEVPLLCQGIIYSVYKAMDEEDKWIKMCKEYNWNRKLIEDIN